MSIQYMQRVCVGCDTITPSTAGTVFAGGGSGYPYMLFGIDATVITAGAQATHECNLQTFAGVELASLEVGTSVAGTYLKAKVAAASQKQDAGNEWRVQSVVNDASAKYSFRVWGTPPTL